MRLKCLYVLILSSLLLSCQQEDREKQTKFYKHNYKAQVHLQNNQFDSSVADYSKALELYPESTLSLAGRGQAYIMLGEFRKAVKDLEKAVQIDLKERQGSFHYHHLGQALYYLGDYEEAILSFHEDLNFNNEFIAADHYFIGLSQLEKGDSAKACSSFRTAGDHGHPGARAKADSLCMHGPENL